jgi:hypothetical protein
MIRNSFMNPPITWDWNRAENTTITTTVGVQDYSQQIADLSFVEKATLTADDGTIIEIKDIINNGSLGKAAASEASRPAALAIQTRDATQTFSFRFLPPPDKVYTVTLEYQKLAPQFGPFFITSAGAPAAGLQTFNGAFDTASFPSGSSAVVSGFATAGNNGTFPVSSVTTSTLVVTNGSGALETHAAYASNYSWAPIPNQYSDVYNNLFLSEALALFDDARAPIFRQRGIGAFLGKATGLTEMQKNIFIQQWIARGNERAAMAGLINFGNTGRGV